MKETIKMADYLVKNAWGKNQRVIMAISEDGDKFTTIFAAKKDDLYYGLGALVVDAAKVIGVPTEVLLGGLLENVKNVEADRPKGVEIVDRKNLPEH